MVVELSVDAHRNTTFAKYSVILSVLASITRTPVTRCLASS